MSKLTLDFLYLWRRRENNLAGRKLFGYGVGAAGVNRALTLCERLFILTNVKPGAGNEDRTRISQVTILGVLP